MAINPMPDPEHAIGPRDRSPLPDDYEVAPGIVINDKVRRGRPRVVGTRITVAEIVDRLVHQRTPEEIIASWPLLTREDIEHAAHYAVALVTVIDWRTAARVYPDFLQGMAKAVRAAAGDFGDDEW